MTGQTDASAEIIGIYDPDRKGIFIHRDQLGSSPFKVGDRFSVRKGKQELFAMTLIKDDQGEIFFDKKGIFIERTRRIDILLGGIFDAYHVFIEPELPACLKIKPLENQ